MKGATDLVRCEGKLIRLIGICPDEGSETYGFLKFWYLTIAVFPHSTMFTVLNRTLVSKTDPSVGHDRKKTDNLERSPSLECVDYYP